MGYELKESLFKKDFKNDNKVLKYLSGSLCLYYSAELFKDILGHAE